LRARAPYLLRASGDLETLDPSATPIGAFRTWNCIESEVTLHPGDTLLIYSDGVTEAESPSGEDFGEERLLRCLRMNRATPASALVHCIVESVTEFSHGSRYDDVTVVAIKAH
jgi:sigma-B regulation protein RsbU (phosphoserine phosphatase)